MSGGVLQYPSSIDAVFGECLWPSVCGVSWGTPAFPRLKDSRHLLNQNSAHVRVVVIVGPFIEVIRPPTVASEGNLPMGEMGANQYRYGR